jgi:hypothetical protein
METLKTPGFTAKDEFNATSSVPIKMAKNSILEVQDMMIKDKLPDKNTGKVETVGFLKATDGTIYATISSTVIEQLLSLETILREGPQKIMVVPHTSNGGREYFTLELQ